MSNCYPSPESLQNFQKDVETTAEYANGDNGVPNVNRDGENVGNLQTLNAQALAIAAGAANLQTYLTKAAMDADTSQPVPTVGQVTNDPDPANNKYYVWNGSTWELSGIQPADATELAALVAAFEQFSAVIHITADGAEIRFMNDLGMMAGRFKEDGTFQTDTMQTDTALINSADFGGGKIDSTGSPPGFAFALLDDQTRMSVGVRDDGTVVANAIQTDTMNGVPVEEFLNPVLIEQTRFTGGLVFLNNIGESIGEGSDGAITTVQEFDNVGFAARASNPVSYVPLTVANTQWGARGESPMYGAAGHIQGLIHDENGVQNYQLLACNNAVSGRILSEISKGSTWYAAELTQIQAARTIAQTEGRSSVTGANLLTIGTNDVTQGTSREVYASLLRKLNSDLIYDTTAITGQPLPPVMIMSQTAHAVDTVSRDVQLAQVDVALDTKGVYLATPLYIFTYYDTLHPVAESSKWLGGYYGLVYKRTVIDGGKWDFLRPVSHFLQGRTLEVSFNSDSPLVLDTAIMPAQVNSGFSLVDGAGAAIAISSVAVKDTSTILVVCAAPIPAGSKLRYGWNRVTGKGTFTGGGGNLRDSLGDTETYTFDVAGTPTVKRLDRWCAIFEYQL